MGDRPFASSGGGDGDVDMGEAGSGPATAAPAGQGLADLEQALGLAAAFFEGDPAAARWAAGDDGPLAGPDQLGLPDEAELDALMGLPGPPPLLRAPFDNGSGDAGAAGLGAPEDEDAAGGSAAASAGAGATAAAAAPAASQLAAGMRGMQLEDIDSEPADVVAPGGAGWGPSCRCYHGGRALPHWNACRGLEARLPTPAPAVPPLVPQAWARCRWRRRWRRGRRQPSPPRRPWCPPPPTLRRRRLTRWLRWRRRCRLTSPSELGRAGSAALRGCCSAPRPPRRPLCCRA